jgi:flagellum-specific peptidoglycan hydrolase FlgJ
MANLYTRDSFTEKFSPFINGVTRGTGILPGTVISQGIIESSGKDPSGNWSVGGSKLAREANNYFGIKCHAGWTGKTYNISTGEVSPSGQKYTDVNACFRKYDSVEDSIRDYVKFLKGNARYAQAGVFTAKTVEEQAAALKKAGYATDPAYAQMIAKVYSGIKHKISPYTPMFIKRNQKATLIIMVILMITAVLLLIYRKRIATYLTT